MTAFYFIRHGESEIQDRLTGRSPGVNLSEKGRRDAEIAAAQITSMGINRVVCSPVDRTKQTAEILASKLGLDYSTLDEIMEVDFGSWTNLTWTELNKDKRWHRFNSFRSGTRIPGGESMIEVQSRMVAAIEKLRTAHPDESIALVSHGDPIRLTLLYFLGIPIDFIFRIKISTASVSIMEIDDSGARVICINNTGQLNLENYDR